MTSLNRLDGESHPRLELCYNFHVTKIKQLSCKIYMSTFLLMTLNSDASVTNLSLSLYLASVIATRVTLGQVTSFNHS
jgi:hypothetical protein